MNLKFNEFPLAEQLPNDADDQRTKFENLDLLKEENTLKIQQSEQILSSLNKEIQEIKERALKENRIKYNPEGKFEYALAANGNRSNLNEHQWLETRTSNFKSFFGNWERYDELKQKKGQGLDETEVEELKKLEAETSKIVDDNGEPLVVYHGTQSEFDTFLSDEGKKFRGNYFANELSKIINYAGLSPVSSNREAEEKIIKEIENLLQKNSGDFEKIQSPEHQLVYERNRKRWADKAKESKKKFKESVFFWMKKKYLKEFKGYSTLSRSYKPIIIEAYIRAVKPLVIDNIGPMSPWVPKELITTSSDEHRNGNWGLFETDVTYAKQNSYDALVWLNTADGGPSGTVMNALDGKQIKSARGNNGEFDISDSNIYH